MGHEILVACAEYFRALRFPHSGDRHFTFFLISGALMMLCVGYIVVLSSISTLLFGWNYYELRFDWPKAFGIVAVLICAFGANWLLLTGYVSRGAQLRRLEMQIAELQSRKP